MNKHADHVLRRVWPSLVLMAIVALAAFLRLSNLRSIPAWYPDEGSWIAIASDALHGQSAYLAFGGSSLIAGRPPLFHWLLAGVFSFTGVDILWARSLTVALGLLTLLILYVIVERMCGAGAALAASAFYAVYPSAVVYHRLALTYNLLAPFYLLVIFGLWRAADASHRRNRWIAVAALCVGFALLTDLAAVSLLVFMILVLLFIRPKALWWTVPLALLPFLIWGGGMWLAAGEFFLQDLAFTFSRTNASLLLQVTRIIFYRTTLESDLWLTLGGLSLLWQSDRRRRWLTAGLFGLTLLTVVRNGPAFGQSSYFLIPLFPLAAWGMGVLLAQGVPILIEQLDATWGSALAQIPRLPRVLNSLILFLLLVAPAFSMIAEGVWLNYSLYTARLGDTLADPAAAGQVAEYVNARTSPEEVVLTSPAIAWLLRAHAADFQMAVAATGKATAHFPANIPLARFRFDPRLETATYVILDPLWRGWGAAQMPEVKAMVQTVEKQWVLQGRIGAFDVYRRPASNP